MTDDTDRSGREAVHRIRGELTSIRGHAELLRRTELQLDDTLRLRFGDAIDDAGAEIDRLVGVLRANVNVPELLGKALAQAGLQVRLVDRDGALVWSSSGADPTEPDEPGAATRTEVRDADGTVTHHLEVRRMTHRADGLGH